jgi:PAS domain S-box-containing protein
MAKPLAVLIVEAVESNLQLILRLLKKAGYKPAFEQVKTPAQLRRALKKQAWEAVISAYSLPKLDAPTALKILQEAGLELPFIVVAEKMGEEAGVEMIKAGASDWVLKDNPGRLVPVLERELKHAAERRESKLAQEALRESEEKWHSLVSATPDYIALHTPDGHFLFLNHYAKGFTEKDVIGTSLYQYISPESVALFREKMTKAVKTWTTQHFEYRGLGDNGARRSYEAFLVPMRDKNQQVEILAAARDITERKQGQEELSASEDKFKYVFEHSVSGKSITLPSGEINVNQAFCEMVGYSQAALKNRTWQELTHPEDIEITREATNKLLSGEKEWVRLNKRYIHKNGSVVWGDVGIALRRVEDGQPLYYVTSINDITEQKRAEEALRDLSIRQEDILAAIPDILMEVGQDKVYTWANPSGLEFFGEDVIGKKAAFYFEGKQDTYDAVTPIFQGRKELIYVESWQRRKDGEKRLLAWWCQGIKDKDGNVTGALSSAEDITERKQVEEALQESEEHFHSLFKNMLNGFAYCRMLFDKGLPQDFIYLEVNDAFETLTGLKNVVGKKISEVLPGVRKSDPVLFEKFGRVALSSVPETFEIYLKALKMWFSVSVYSPRKEYFIAVFDVISERKRAEESIRNLARFPSENPNPVLRVARDGQLLYANKAALLLLKDLGWEPGKPLPEVLKGPACKAFETRTTKTIEISSGEQTYSITMAPALEDEDINLYALDITERKQAEEEIKTMLRTTIDGYYLVDVRGRILDANDSYSMMIGYSHEELLKMHVKDIEAVDSDELIKKRIQRILETGSDHFETKHRRKDGKVIDIEASVNYLIIEEKAKLFCFMRDITERKQAEENLRESEEKYRNLFNNSEVGMFRTRLDGSEILEFNNKYLKMLNYTFEDVKGKPSGNLWADKRERDKMVQLLKDEGQVADFECGILNKQGEVRRCITSLRLYRDTGILEGSIQDITERKRAEQDLRDSEERFRSLYENATIGMYRTSPEGGILMANPALVSMLGYESFEELSRRDLASDGYEPGYPRLEFQNRIEQDGDVRGLESAWKRSDGSIIFVRESAHLVRNKNDQPLYYEGTVEDITERKQAEEALRRSETELRALFASMHDLVMEIDRTGVYRKIAPTNYELLVKPPEELIGSHLGDVFPKNHADIFINVMRKVIETKQPAQIEYDLPIGKRTVRFETSIAPLTEDSTLWVAHDITERKHAEEKIRQLNADLEQRVEERTRELRQAQDKIVRQEKLAVLGQLAGGVGHELRNPLGIISSGVYYLKLIQPDADAKVRQYHAMIEQEVRNSEKIITDLLDYARLESMEREQVAVPELVRTTLARFTVPESIKITLRLPADLPRVHADLLQMEQVLGNLTVNACQAMITSSSKRGVSAQGATKGAVKGSRLSISARRVGPVSANPPKSRAGQARQKGMVAISVKDNGAGITPENMSKLFEPLFTTKSKGIGLGLAVSRKLAEANGGRIEVKSVVGKGSTFTLFLPVEAGKP